jgi:Ca2+-binding RTX toxin-like protein
MKNALAINYWADVMGIDAAQMAALSSGDSFAVDAPAAAAEDEPLATGPTDTVPDEITNNNPELVVGGPSIISTIDAPGDQDFFKIELQAGQTYEIGQYGTTEGMTHVPLGDAYIELYDSDGNLVAAADAGGQTPSGELYGLDAMLTVSVETAGTYYVNARSFDQSPEDGTDGEGVGDYELFARTSSYVPYYEQSSPLHSIDWGTQVDGTVRNPDGEEGPRPTGNEPNGTPESPYQVEGKNVITYYFAEQGDVYVTEDPTDPGLTDTIVASGMEEWEKNAFEDAFEEFSEVADVVYVEVFNREEADFNLITYNGTPQAGVLGRMSPPDTHNEGQAEFNRNGPGWTEEQLQRGGFSFITLVHELGHGHGLAHPHDDGGRSSIMRGTESTGGAFDYTLGDYNLNQGVFTMMSYQDGWQTSPYGNSPDDGYGYLEGPMAFDIAVIQDKYGVNEDTAAGDDIYRLKDVNAAGTYYEAIWDAGGHDLMVYDGARNSKIDLRDATLQYEIGGGGRVSYAHGIYGGYTIANSVTIEDARSGSGNDLLNGNEVGNLMIANAGNDIIRGLGGADALHGGTGNDKLLGGAHNDNLSGDEGADLLSGQTGNDRLAADDGNDIARGGDGNDRVSGGDGDDRLNGNLGNDVVIGGAGLDQLNGGSGADLFVFGELDTGSSRNTADHLLDFSRDNGDKISLAQIDAIEGTAANDSFSFIGNSAFTGTAGELRFFVSNGDAIISADTNGDKIADLVLVMEDRHQLAATDFQL